jgi:3-hydroxyisobutyrate dehydrogenase-like beta-hydroxyacid dehydrogenase
MTYVAKDRPRIGRIGAGRMGFQLAGRLLDAVHDVAVYNRTRAKPEPLAERGAAIVDRPDQLADQDMAFVMVSASADLEVVTTGLRRSTHSPGPHPGLPVNSSTVSTQI